MDNQNTLIHARRIETVVSYKGWLGQIALTSSDDWALCGFFIGAMVRFTLKY